MSKLTKALLALVISAPSRFAVTFTLYFLNMEMKLTSHK